MSQAPPNPFAVPDDHRPDQAQSPYWDTYGDAYGQPGAAHGRPDAIPAYGTPSPQPYDAPVADAPAYGPPPAGGYPAPHGNPYAARPRTNGLAIASMATGIASVALCMFAVPAVVGLILGIVALQQIKYRGDGGRSMAIAGVVTSAVSLVAFAVLLVIGLVDSSTSTSTQSPVTQHSLEA